RGIAADVSSGQPERIADKVYQKGPVLNLSGDEAPVHLELDLSHSFPPVDASAAEVLPLAVVIWMSVGSAATGTARSRLANFDGSQVHRISAHSARPLRYRVGRARRSAVAR